jgi:hypothetical protein
VNRKTFPAWKKRRLPGEGPTGPKGACSTVISIEEKAVIRTSGASHVCLDDSVQAFLPAIRTSTRSWFHRVLDRM